MQGQQDIPLNELGRKQARISRPSLPLSLSASGSPGDSSPRGLSHACKGMTQPLLFLNITRHHSQAKAAAQGLLHMPVDVVYSSDLSRAYETAEIIVGVRHEKVRQH